MTALRTVSTVLVVLLIVGSSVQGGDTYTITSTDGKKTMTYAIHFGGGKLFERLTAFDPKSKKFVYLDWKRGEPTPTPAGAIWNHHAGQLIQLYNFPGVDQPLPAIPSIKDLQVCPYTGDRSFKVNLSAAYD